MESEDYNEINGQRGGRVQKIPNKEEVFADRKQIHKHSEVLEPRGPSGHRNKAVHRMEEDLEKVSSLLVKLREKQSSSKKIELEEYEDQQPKRLGRSLSTLTTDSVLTI